MIVALKHLLRELTIGALDVSGVLTLYLRRLKKRSQLVRIVVFHDVPDAQWFTEVLQYLHSHTRVLTPQEFYDQQFSSDHINVLITFDDGYASWVDVALPALNAYGYTALFFINSGLLDVANETSASESFFRDRLLISPKPPLSWSGAQALVAAGHRIGGHTVSHPFLSDCTYETCLTEIQNDKQRIESKLSVALSDFAYPFGTRASISPEVMLAAKDVGYTRAYTAESDFVNPDGDLWVIPRLCLEKMQPLSSVDRWVRGGFDLFSKMKHSV